MKNSPWLLLASLAFLISLGPIFATQDVHAQSPSPSPYNLNDYPHSKEGNLIVNVADLLYAAQDSSMQAGFKGQHIEVIGQLMPDATNNAKGYHFKLQRQFFGDEMPNPRGIAIPVECAVNPGFAAKSWVKVVGMVEFGLKDGKPAVVVKAGKVETIDPPQETTLY